MVTIVVPSYPPEEIGGMELQAKRLAELLDAGVITKRYKKKDPRVIGEIPYVKTPSRILNYMLYTLLFSIKMQFIKTDEKIISFMLSPSGFASALKSTLNRRKKVFSWIRGGDWYFLKNNILGRRIIRYTIKHSTAIICQTERIKREVESEFNKRCYVIGNGVDMRDKVAKGNKILFVGNLTKRKGVKYLIEAMKKMPDEELTIVYAHGDQSDFLKKIAPKNVTFIKDSNNELEKYYLDAKVLVLPAVEGEGLPNVILEAYSYGLPVIATNIAGIPDIVKDNETGFLIEPKDPNGIIEAIGKINKDMGIKGREFVKRYSWENIVKEVRSLLEKSD